MFVEASPAWIVWVDASCRLLKRIRPIHARSITPPPENSHSLLLAKQAKISFKKPPTGAKGAKGVGSNLLANTNPYSITTSRWSVKRSSIETHLGHTLAWWIGETYIRSDQMARAISHSVATSLEWLILAGGAGMRAGEGYQLRSPWEGRSRP